MPMMKRIWPITLTLGLAPLGASAHEFVVRTIFGAVFCETPFQLRKAIIAADEGEGEQVRQLGCIRSGEGIEAIVTDQIALPFGPWQVRLMSNDAPSLILWGYASDFKSIHDPRDLVAMPASK